MNLAKYDFTLDGFTPPWRADDLHINILHEIAMECTGNVVEVGCFRGRSTAAFVEAINRGAQFTLHLVDVKITPEVRRVVSMCKSPERVHIHETHSSAFRLSSADLWFVDADHTWPAVLDVLNALASGAQIIVMHDSRAHTEGFTECEGASLAADALRNFAGRDWVEDAAHRPNEWTHRGLLASIATSDPAGEALAERVKDIFAEFACE